MQSSITWREFLRQTLTLALPIAFQQLMLALSSCADTLMLTNVGQNELSAVSLATQFQFIFSLVSCRAHAWHEHSGGPVLGCGQHECRRTCLGVHHAVCRRIVAGVFRIDATHSGNVDVDYDERCDADCHRLTVFAGFRRFRTCSSVCRKCICV